MNIRIPNKNKYESECKGNGRCYNTIEESNVGNQRRGEYTCNSTDQNINKNASICFNSVPNNYYVVRNKQLTFGHKSYYLYINEWTKILFLTNINSRIIIIVIMNLMQNVFVFIFM